LLALIDPYIHVVAGPHSILARELDVAEPHSPVGWLKTGDDFGFNASKEAFTFTDRRSTATEYGSG
jgi:hypothetical protein